MHITIITLGSRGDAQPCVALGRGLVQAGYQVRIATHGIFADLVGRCGLEFAPIEGNPRVAKKVSPMGVVAQLIDVEEVAAH